MKLTKILAVVLTIAILFSFAGCSKADTSSDNDRSDEIIDAIEFDDTAQSKLLEGAKGTKIRKIGDIDEMEGYGYQITLEFMEDYDIEIEWIPMGYSEYVSKLPQMVAAGNPPDTAVMTDATALSFMYGNLVMPINDYITLEDKYWDEDVLNNFSIDGNYYAVNTGDIDTFFVYYNKTLFDELGLEDPYTLYKNGKWTFDKLRELAKKATTYESDKTTVSCYGIGTHYKEVFALAFGGNIIDYNEGTSMYESSLKSAATVAGLNYLKDLCKDGSMNPSVAGFTEFPFRKIAMFVERPQHAIGNYDLLNTMKDEIGIVPLPASPIDGKQYAASNLITNMVPTNATNPVGGMAWNYFWLRRLVEGENTENSTWSEYWYKMMTKEHETVIKDYLGKAKKVSSKLESISGWNNYHDQFWSDLIWNHKTAEEVSAAMEGIVSGALSKTIGE